MTAGYDKLVNEAMETSHRLLKSVERLGRMGDLPIGSCEREAVATGRKLTLYHYTPRRREVLTPPVLIVYALVNRPYMLDLDSGHSLIRRLLDQGLDVYLLDWGTPDRGDRGTSMATYVEDYLDFCVDEVRRRSDQEAVTLLGICQGGTLSCCYAALHPEKVARLVTTVTPIDFHTKHDRLSRTVRKLDVDALVDVYGNVPGELLNTLFLSLKPFRLGFKKYLDLARYSEDEERLAAFLRMERWIFDSPPQCGEAFREFLRDFYQQNLLVTGRYALAGRAVVLAELTMPVLNVYASDDHLVPPEASLALADYVGTDDYSEHRFAGGHIGLYVSQRAQREVPQRIASWLRERDPAAA